MPAINPRTFTIAKSLEEKIQKILKENFKLTLNDSAKLAKCVERLSDFYIRMPGNQTPWKETWCQIAYLVYYLPLNEIRARAVHEEGNKFGFFDLVKNICDYGSGLGAATFYLDQNANFNKNLLHVEESEIAQALHQTFKTKGSWAKNPIAIDNKSLLIMSYSLTELEDLPHWAIDYHSLMIIEPSSKENSRSLLKIREQLLNVGFSIWAPCTHQGKCPLLHQSKNDWCHDRVHFDQPQWFQSLEQHLPMKNQTLTFSYLLASREKPRHDHDLARITGDLLNENGKSRQLVCRNEEREFLTWMHKDKKKGLEIPEIPRGNLIRWPTEFTTVSNEIRLAKPIEIMK